MESMSSAEQSRFFGQLDTPSELLALFDLVPGVSFFIKDRRGRFMAMNRRGCEYAGVAEEADAVGKTDYDFFPSARADEYRADDERVLQSGEPILNRIESAPESFGSPRLVMTSKMPLRDRHGQVIGLAGFSRQVEQLRRPAADVNAFAHVVEYMHLHFDRDLRTPDLAKEARLSVSQFERRFRRAFGTTVRQYLVRIRVENAAGKLVETDSSVSQIAQQCGFYDHAHFSRAFRSIMHTTPSEWRTRNRES